MMRCLTLSRRAALALAGAVAVAGPAAAQDEVSFEGETIEWIVPFSAGGGTDTWARFNAPFLSEYLPGNPEVVVVNEPGGGSTQGANMFAARAQPDGTALLGTSGSTQFPYLLNDPRVNYEYQNWRIVMAYPTGGVVYTKPDIASSPDEIGQLREADLTYASQGASSLDLVPLLAWRLMDLGVEHVFGFQGRGQGRLAFERGETNIDYQTSSAYLDNVVPMVEAGNATPLFSWGALDEQGNLIRDPTFPDLPHFGEAYEMLTGEPPSGEQFQSYMAFFAAGFPAQKMLFLPEGTSDAIVETYQEAVRQMKQDEDYQAQKGDVLGTYEQVTGQQAQALFETATGVPAEARQRVVDMLESEYDVDLGSGN